MSKSKIDHTTVSLTRYLRAVYWFAGWWVGGRE